MRAWEQIALGDVLHLHYGKALDSSLRDSEGSVPVYGANGIKDHAEVALTTGPVLVIGRKGSAGEVTRVDGPLWPLDVTYYTEHDKERVEFDFLEYMLRVLDLPALAKGVKPGINRNDVYSLEVSLPLLGEQKRIVAKLDQAFAALDRARANAEANAADLSQLRDSIISTSLESALDACSKKIRLGELCAIARGGSPRPISKFLTDDPQGINWIKISDATASGKFIERTKERIIPEGASRSRYVTSGSFLLTNSMSFGRPYILRTNGCIHDGWLVLEPDYKQVDQEYLYYLLGSRQVYGEFDRLAAGSTVRNLNIDLVSRVSIRLPPLEKQRETVASIVVAVGAVDKLVKVNERKLADLTTLRQSLLQAAFSGQLS